MCRETSWPGPPRPSSRRVALRVRAAAWLGLAWLAGVPATALGQTADESFEQRQAHLQSLSDAEKFHLLQDYRRFQELPTAEQDRLRQLHQQLTNDPDREQLEQVLERYYNWLRSLTPPERAEVLSLPADQRIERIRALMRTQDARRFRMMVGGFMMSPQDLTTIHEWFDQFLDEHAQAILATLPDEQYARLKQEYDPQRDRNLLRFLYFRNPSPELPRPSREDEARLQARVSKPAQEVLALAGDEERSRVIQRWTGAAALSRLRTNPSVEELQQFAQESLSDAERFRLESLPRDRMYRELRMLYSQRQFGGDPARGFPRFRRGGDGAWQLPPGGPGDPPPDGPPPPPPWDGPKPPPPRL
ncbi:MAG: hypothetical protein MUF48_20325 [Pirellulaceae bacterium]|jgi:hypothetical protein|nr:hypothetical protein [Pirellulaceae bacterium]